MALIWADGFDHYGATADFLASAQYVYHTNDQSQPLAIGTNPALIRTGGHYWDASGQKYNDWWGGRIVGGNANKLIAGAAFYFAGPPNVDNYCPFMFTTTNLQTFQCSVRLNPDGSLSVHTGKDGAAFGASNPGVVTWGSYCYIELKVLCDGANGTLEVRVNNSTVLAVVGVNTNPVGTGTLMGVMCGTRNNFNNSVPCLAISDFYICNGVGARNTDFLGDIRCRTIYPNANGADQAWVPHGAANAWDCVDNVPAQAGVKYISASNVGDKSSFGLTDIPTNTATIFGVMMATRVNKSDAGLCEVTPGLDSGGSVASGTPINPGTGDALYTSIFEVDPNGGASFNYARLNALLATVRRSA